MTTPITLRIESILAEHPVVLFMKGTAEFPMCGFSATVVKILEHVGAPFYSVNVLEEMEIREGIKAYADWPTIPQLYIKGEFIGGCDIAREMLESGELRQALVDAKIVA
jgi:monothiol glutaredoxin